MFTPPGSSAQLNSTQLNSITDSSPPLQPITTKKTMGKANKNTTGAAAPKQHPNAQLFARMSHLYRASSALAAAATSSPAAEDLSKFYVSHLRSIAKKNVLRLDPAVKRTICKRCEALLIPGVSCRERIENQSKGGKKRWADVLVVECNTCGTVKRFPVGMDEFKATKGQLKYRPKGKEEEEIQPGGGELQPDKKDTKGNPPADKNTGKKDGKKKQQQESRVFKLPAALTGTQVGPVLVVRDTAVAKETPKPQLTQSGDVEMKDISAIEQVING
jgi:ribonuclease P protein subunit RPR2